jgi:hypothetical protein
MRHVYNIRVRSGDDGTLGHWVTGEFQCFTLELPWLNNQQDVSCIPAGIYAVKWEPEGKHKGYAVEDVPGRSAIEIHIGNTTKDIEGCIALGFEAGTRWGKFGVWRSAAAIKRFETYMNHEDFTLEILDKTKEA